MASLMVWSVTMTVVVALTGLMLFLYSKSGAPKTGGGATPGETANATALVAREQRANSTVAANQNTPETSFRPRIKTLDLKDCDSDSSGRAHCGSSSTEPQGPAAHRRVHDDLLTFPPSRFPRDARFNALLPAGQRQMFEGIFHLNLTYRRDNELHVHWKLNLRPNPDGPQMEPVAWIRESGRRCFREPRKRIDVGVLQRSSNMWAGQNCFMRTSSCQFYLRLHRDCVTEPFRGARVLAGARRNSGNVAPFVPSVYTGAVPDAAKLAEFLLSLDPEHRILMSFFKWKLFYNGRRGRAEERVAFLCQA
ncbi:uncharacterized protein LOC130518607 isoform X1 [Takifugu flavidus]|uniref:uncharacterized protein LOC130518607 isoform X1 n=1 Tax=Takifugu flavidus TaxID=433684 RepID=UPI0025448866|nr:uncharacterized protein LOC130518607 isoform X1 [Takifugu flavidus]XP_056877332.1 uncharacterized protein LOC130518607 isoform X1 [Takifugu flavidus]